MTIIKRQELDDTMQNLGTLFRMVNESVNEFQRELEKKDCYIYYSASRARANCLLKEFNKESVKLRNIMYRGI